MENGQHLIKVKPHLNRSLLNQEPDRNIPQPTEHPLPRPDDASEEQKTGQSDSDAKTGQWQRNSDLTPEAWQQQMDQQLRQEESEQQAEAQGSHGHSQQSPESSAVVFRDSKSMKTLVQSGVQNFTHEVHI